MKVQIINRSHHALPQYATPQSAGLDLRANLSSPIELRSFGAQTDTYRTLYRTASGL